MKLKVEVLKLKAKIHHLSSVKIAKLILEALLLLRDQLIIITLMTF